MDSKLLNPLEDFFLTSAKDQWKAGMAQEFSVGGAPESLLVFL